MSGIATNFNADVGGLALSSNSELQALVYDILPSFLEEGAGKRCSECALTLSPVSLLPAFRLDHPVALV